MIKSLCLMMMVMIKCLCVAGHQATEATRSCPWDLKERPSLQLTWPDPSTSSCGRMVDGQYFTHSHTIHRVSAYYSVPCSCRIIIIMIRFCAWLEIIQNTSGRYTHPLHPPTTPRLPHFPTSCPSSSKVFYWMDVMTETLKIFIK